MNNFKGFDINFAKKTKKSKRKSTTQEMKQIQKRLKNIDRQTARNRNNPQALKEFKQLVAEGNPEKLAQYFEQYGIDRTFAQLNLNTLIAEELQDLSK